MITIEIPERNHTLYLPEYLEECDASQYIDMSDLIHRYNSQKITYDDFKVQAIYKLLNLIPKDSNEKATQEKLSNIYMLTDAVDNYFTLKEGGEKSIKLTHTHNHLPKIKPLWRSYYGPTDFFKNIKFGEYSDAINLYLEYNQTKDESLLYTIMAIFYRKKQPFHFIKKHLKGYDGDVRESYNEISVDQRAKVLKVLPVGYAYGFYLFLASFHQYITQAKISINGETIDFSRLFDEPTEKTAKSDMPGLGLKSIEYKIAETGVFGDDQKVRNTSMWEIYIRLYDITKNYEDEKARIHQAKEEAKSKNKS